MNRKSGPFPQKISEAALGVKHVTIESKGVHGNHTTDEGNMAPGTDGLARLFQTGKIDKTDKVFPFR